MNISWSAWGTPIELISKQLEEIFYEKPIILCLGSDKVLEDCLGPLCGTMLSKLGYQGFVYGTLEAPIFCQNVECAFNFVKAVHPNRKILVIDASTTKDSDRLGKIVLAKNYQPFNLNLKNVNLKADWFLFGVCSTNQGLSLAGSRMAIVQKIADTICSAIIKTQNACLFENRTAQFV